MASQHLVGTKSIDWLSSSVRLGRSWPGAAGLAHLVCMKTTAPPETGLGPVLRVGRELRFRVSEVDAWLAQMEANDAERHPRQAG